MQAFEVVLTPMIERAIVKLGFDHAAVILKGTALRSRSVPQQVQHQLLVKLVLHLVILGHVEHHIFDLVGVAEFVPI